jgi:soluble lytic murein transglycosylase
MIRAIRGNCPGERFRRTLTSGLLTGFLALSTAASALEVRAEPVENRANASPSLRLTRQNTIALPEILAAGDVVLYRRILAAQETGDWATADRMISGLQDRRLLGHVYADRYLAKSYKAKFAELAAWMANYADLPEASLIYTLAGSRKPSGAGRISKPAGAGYLSGTGDDLESWRDQAYKPAATDAQAERLSAEIHAALHRNAPAEAAAILKRKTTPADPVAFDQLRAETAAALFATGASQAALDLARPAARSADKVPQAAWVAGLAAWRLNHPEAALGFFEQVAQSSAASNWSASAGAFWAARVYEAANRRAEARSWCERAAANPYTFYGLLARRQLGLPASFDWSLPAVHAREVAALQEYPGVTRALALIQIGDRDDAEEELRTVFPRLPEELAPTLLTIAERGGMPGLAMRLGAHLIQTTGARYDAAMYPLPPWVPSQGFSVNRALLYAFARQESHFATDAVSPQGASGLMQIMPGTAKLVADRGGIARGGQLDDPSTSLDLAQRLIASLLDHDRIKGDLLSLSIAYNSGFGVMAKYQDKLNYGDDPLLFLEALPSSESRRYIERVLANFWVYQARLGQKPDTLDSLAEGKWPIYIPQPRQVEVAQSNGRN